MASAKGRAATPSSSWRRCLDRGAGTPRAVLRCSSTAVACTRRWSLTAAPWRTFPRRTGATKSWTQPSRKVTWRLVSNTIHQRYINSDLKLTLLFTHRGAHGPEEPGVACPDGTVRTEPVSHAPHTSSQRGCVVLPGPLDTLEPNKPTNLYFDET